MSARSIPRYQALKDGILERIASGSLGPGDRVPSENELAESAGVSRMTANRALRELTDEGYLERVTGSGSFVADFRATSHPLEVRNIADEVAARGHRYAARVLVQELTVADSRVAAAFKTKAGTPVYHARVVHLENERPIQLEDRYVLPDFAGDFLDQDFTQRTPSAYLSSVSPLQDAEQVVRAEMPDSASGKALDMAAGEPCLVVTRRTFSGGAPVTYGRFIHPGSRFELSGRYSPVAGGPGRRPVTGVDRS